MVEKRTNETLDQRVQELEQEIDRFKQIEKVNKQNQIEFDALFNKSPLVMFIVDRDRRVCKLNAAAVVMTRRIKEESIGLRGGEALRCINPFDDPRGCGFSEVCKSCVVRNTVLDTFRTGQEYQSVEATMPYSAENEIVILQVLVSTTLLKLPQGDRVFVCIEDITERKRSQDALRESKKRFRILSESLVDTVYEFNLKGKFTYVNEAGVRLFGYSKNEIREIQVKDTISKEDHARSKEDIGDIFKGKEIVGERIFIRRDGSTFIGEVHSGPIYKEKTVIGVRGVIRDITERKQAEEELKKNKEQLVEVNQLLSGVLEHTHMMAAYLDSRFDFIWVNHAYAAADNHEPPFFIGKNHFELYPHEENQAIFQRVVDTGESFFVAAKQFEYPKHPERGLTYWDWSLIPIKDNGGIVTGLVFTLAEVTEAVRDKEVLSYRKLQFEAVLNNLDSSIYISDMESNEILFMNDYMKKLFGTDLTGNLCWKSFYDNQDEPCKFCTNDKLIDTDGNATEPYVWEVYNQKLERWYEMHDQAIPWTDGRLVRLEIAIDITNRKQSEEEREKLIGELQTALAEIKKLSGLLPICAHCKRIRDDKGYWNNLEGYIQTHSDAKFSHSMCPECSDELYGKEDWYIEMKKEKQQKE